jgi:hypothetical protein
MHVTLMNTRYRKDAKRGQEGGSTLSTGGGGGEREREPPRRPFDASSVLALFGSKARGGGSSSGSGGAAKNPLGSEEVEVGEVHLSERTGGADPATGYYRAAARAVLA